MLESVTRWRSWLLFVFLLVVAILMLVWHEQHTEARLTATANQYRQAQLATILPNKLCNEHCEWHAQTLPTRRNLANIYINNIDVATKNKQKVATIYTATTKHGYVGPIELFVAINNRGEVLAVRPGKHRETVGIGSLISDESWLSQWHGYQLQDFAPEQWRLRQDGGVFDAISGATVTSRSILLSIFDVLSLSL
ncbi:MAG: RnfABCDGE type electron transport complex subunit G [Gammaproteobacteria bacterium]|nr:RnfABCDGE type electron transport complex subunit G [Gammaproteobacteria bacterium]